MGPSRNDGGEVRDVASQPDRLEAFYREHLPFVRRYLARRLDQPADVADLTADVFTTVIRSASSYDATLGSPRAWLTGIMRNLLSAHRRSAARRVRTDERLLGHRLLDEDSTQRIVERIDAERRAHQLLADLRDLPAALRDVVELVVVDELTLVEAAAVLSISPGTARVRYHRARHALRHSLAPTTEGAAT